MIALNRKAHLASLLFCCVYNCGTVIMLYIMFGFFHRPIISLLKASIYNQEPWELILCSLICSFFTFKVTVTRTMDSAKNFFTVLLKEKRKITCWMMMVSTIIWSVHFHFRVKYLFNANLSIYRFEIKLKEWSEA